VASERAKVPANPGKVKRISGDPTGERGYTAREA
jgi:hypothetical protein